MQNDVHFWQEVHEFYQNTNILKMLKQIPAEDHVFKETFICGEFLRFGELQKVSKEESTSVKKPNGKSTQKPSVGEGNKRLAQLTLRFDFLTLAMSVSNVISSKHEFAGVVSKLRSELKGALKAAVGYVETLHGKALVEARNSLVCLLQSMLRFFASDMQSIRKLHLLQELTMLFVLLINNWSVTGFEDNKLAVVLAGNLSTILTILEDTVGRSILIEGVLLNIYAISELKGYKGAEESLKINGFKSVFKTEDAIEKLIKSGRFSAEKDAKSEHSTNKVIVLQHGSTFGLRVLFHLLDELVTCEEPMLLKMESVSKLLFGWNLSAVFSLSIANHPYNQLLILKMLKFVIVLFTRSHYLRQMYGGKVLALVKKCQLRSEDNFKLLMQKSVSLMTLLIEIEELQEETLIAVEKCAILQTGMIVARMLVNGNTNDIGAQKNITFEDGNNACLEDTLKSSSVMQLQKILKKIGELAVKIVQMTPKSTNSYFEVVKKVYLFFKVLSVLRLDQDVFGYQVNVKASDELTEVEEPRLKEEEKVEEGQRAVVTEEQIRMSNPYEFKIDEWLSFKDIEAPVIQSDSSRGQLLRDSFEKSEGSNQENNRRCSERHRRPDQGSELSFSNFPTPPANDLEIDQAFRSSGQVTEFNAPRSYRTTSLKGSVSQNTSLIEIEHDSENTADELRLAPPTGAKRVRRGFLKSLEASSGENQFSRAQSPPVMPPPRNSQTEESRDLDLKDLPEIDLN